MVLITLLSLFSFSDVDKSRIEIPHLDKIVHFVFYFVAALLGCFFMRELTKGRMNIKKAIAIIIVLVIVYGIVIEVLQGAYTTQRSGEFYDVLANSLGAFAGAAVIYYLFSGKTQLKWNN